MSDIKDFVIENGILTQYNGNGGDVVIPDGVTGIGIYAFAYRSSLTSIIIPDTVTSIGDSAFANCTSLTSVTIPYSVTNINRYAFKNCISLTSITIPYSVTSIDFSVFENCESLEIITIPDSVTSIGDSAFANCTSLASVTIPDSVTRIGVSAFLNCASLTSISIPDSVKSIGTYAFERCPNLADENGFVIINGMLLGYYGSDSNVVIPDSVTSIECNMFRRCLFLTNITIPASVTSIGYAAFSNCTSLTSVTIPDSVTSIGNYAFSSCPELADKNGFVIINGVLTGYYGSDSHMVIPDSVTSIGYAAFANCTSLASLTIPDSVTSIGDSAFANCTSLASLTIPDSITSIGCNMFTRCLSLSNITIPDSVTSIGDSAFESCTSLTNITIPDSVTSIGNSAFEDCKSLTSITIPDGVTSIGRSAFQNCTSLTSITIPDSVTSIRYAAFSNCSELASVTLPNTLAEIADCAFEKCNKLSALNFNGKADDAAIEAVFDYFSATDEKFFMFEEMLSNYYEAIVNNARIVKIIKTNAKKAFDLAVMNDNAEFVENLFSLYKTIKLDKLNEYIEKASETTALKAFLLDYKARNYSFDKQEKYENEKFEKELGIKERTIADWKKIFTLNTEGETAVITGYKGTDITVEIPERIGKYKVVAIKEYAFSPNAPRLNEEHIKSRTNIENVVIPDGITTIEDGTFNACTNLLSVMVPQSVTKIGEYAFAYCKNLKHINIDFAEVEIGNDAFHNCDGLTNENGFLVKNKRLYALRSDINNYSVPEGIERLDNGTVMFKNVDNLITDIHKMSEEALRYVVKRKSEIHFPHWLKKIPDGTEKTNTYSYTVYYEGFCSGSEKLKKVSLSEEITEIGTYAFYRCKNLNEITFHEGLIRIGEGAFSRTGLRKVSIPSTVSVISNEAFSDCKDLMVVNICEGVERISANAFARCPSLKEVYIPASVTSINEYAFSSNKIKTIYTPAGSYAEKYAKEKKIKVKNEKEQISDNAIPFEYKISKNKTVKLTAYISDNTEVMIPAQIEGCPVTDFNKDIFKNNKLISSVVWPESISVLPKEIFFGCSSLKKVVLPEGVEKISEKAFRNCTSLVSIHLPSSLTEIHEKAFECAKNTINGWEYWNCLEVIYGYPDSCAATFAYENHILFEAEK